MSASDGGDGGVISGGLSVGCLAPCHSFTGLVEQWKTSTHYSTYIANLGGEEVASWTGKTACGNCHAIDGIQQRVAGNVLSNGATPPDATHGQTNYLNSLTNKVAESTYAGHATVAVVHCSTCHEVNSTTDPHVTGKPYVPGSFPLRVPASTTDQALLEKSSAVGMSTGTPAGQYGRGNVCIWCHKSRKDVTNYITASNTISNSYWGPHEGPQSDIYTGKGGYHYAGKKYENSSHQAFTNGCVDCHMPRTAGVNQGVGDHSFYPKLSSCQKAGCHVGVITSFDIIGGQSAVKERLRQLRTELNRKGWLTRSTAAPYAPLSEAQLADDAFTSDMPMPNPTSITLTADEAGALYNYLLAVRGSALGVHNPLYVRQLIWDSFTAIGGVTTDKRPGTQ